METGHYIYNYLINCLQQNGKTHRLTWFTRPPHEINRSILGQSDFAQFLELLRWRQYIECPCKFSEAHFEPYSFRPKIEICRSKCALEELGGGRDYRYRHIENLAASGIGSTDVCDGLTRVFGLHDTESRGELFLNGFPFYRTPQEQQCSKADDNHNDVLLKAYTTLASNAASVLTQSSDTSISQTLMSVVDGGVIPVLMVC